jgi:hypothetical protein
MENELRLLVMPDVIKYHAQMENAANMMHRVKDMALIDFMMVSSVFKKYREAQAMPDTDDSAKQLSLSVTELQYIDILSQKLEHITRLNEAIRKADNSIVAIQPNEDQAGFIFKLNYLQVLVASEEFLSNAINLRNHLRNLHDHIVVVTQLDFEERDYFRHFHEIELSLKVIRQIVKEMTEERLYEAPISACAMDGQLPIISKIYTMTSERFVLRWLFEHPLASEDELLSSYQQDGYDHGQDEIELF